MEWESSVLILINMIFIMTVDVDISVIISMIHTIIMTLIILRHIISIITRKDPLFLSLKQLPLHTQDMDIEVMVRS